MIVTDKYTLAKYGLAGFAADEAPSPVVVEVPSRATWFALGFGFAFVAPTLLDMLGIGSAVLRRRYG